MKALSIGRDQECDIIINDATDVISRRHATLNISSSGKITIVDLSRNGTYVNGIRISPNVPVPVSRKDIISFAHVNKLDWNAVPTYNSMTRYIVMGGVGIFIVACVYPRAKAGYCQCYGLSQSGKAGSSQRFYQHKKRTL